MIDGPYYQDVWIGASAKLSSGADNAGLVFAYRDALNFWVKLWSKASQTVRVYEVSNGAWTQKYSSSVTITADVAFSMNLFARGGYASPYETTLPAGQVGLWSSHSSGNEFDSFVCRDAAGPYEVDGRWFSDKGDTKVDASDSNVLEALYASNDYHERCIVRRGFRGDKFVATYRFKWNAATTPGFLVRWVNPGDWLGIGIAYTDGKARLYQRKDDAAVNALVASSTALSLTSNTWYTARVVIGDDLGNSALQRLRFWVDTDGDADFADETTLLDTTTVDNDWSAGAVGLFLQAGGTTQAFDDFKVGIDNNADLDIDDAGDDVQIDDDFSSSTLTLTYDDNGNLTDDGVLKFEYDAWNRLVKAKRRVDAYTVIATYSYDGLNRRAKKVVQNQGVEIYPNDGGNTTVNFYYGAVGSTGVPSVPWNIFETRNGSNQTTWQYVWGTQYVDEIVLAEKNGTPSASNDTDPDTTASGEATESPADHRYFYHQDRNWNVSTVTDYGGGNNGNVVERATYTPYGARVLANGGSTESGVVTLASTTGHAFGHQGLPNDNESDLDVVRRRVLSFRSNLYNQPDPVQYRDGFNRYLAFRGNSISLTDPLGLTASGIPGCQECANCDEICGADPTLEGKVQCVAGQDRWTKEEARSGTPCCCLCIWNIRRLYQGTDMPPTLTFQCAIDHESVHVAQCSSGTNPDTHECDGYARQAECVEQNLTLCTTDLCLRNLLTYLDTIASRCKEYRHSDAPHLDKCGGDSALERCQAAVRRAREQVECEIAHRRLNGNSAPTPPRGAGPARPTSNRSQE